MLSQNQLHVYNHELVLTRKEFFLKHKEQTGHRNICMLALNICENQFFIITLRSLQKYAQD